MIRAAVVIEVSEQGRLVSRRRRARTKDERRDETSWTETGDPGGSAGAVATSSTTAPTTTIQSRRKNRGDDEQTEREYGNRGVLTNGSSINRSNQRSQCPRARIPVAAYKNRWVLAGWLQGYP